MPDVLVISDDVAGEKMAGPGIRAWELSRRLAEYFRTALAIPDYSPGLPSEQGGKKMPFDLARYAVSRPAPLRQAAEDSRVVIVQGYVLSKFPFLKNIAAHLVCDLYVPFPLENLFVHRRMTPAFGDRVSIHLHDLAVFNEQLVHGDHFLCANERQKDFIIGALLALDRVDPGAVDASPSLDGLVSVVPFGFNDDEEVCSGDMVLREVVPGIGKEDAVFLWGGVLSNWFDPLTLIRAVGRAAAIDPRIKLFFLSTGHPNPLLPSFDMAAEASRLSDSLGLTGEHVFFNRGWVAYARRGAYFREADAGVYAHGDHIETRFAFRTRVLDYLKHGLPILCTEGDSFADLVQNRKMGLVVPCGDTEAMAQALLTLAGDALFREECRKNIAQVRPLFTWDKTAAPLVAYCRDVLDGRISKGRKPDRSDLAAVTGIRKKGVIEKVARRRLWFLARKLPPGLVARIRRILKALGWQP